VYFTDQGQTGLHDPTGRVYRLCTDGRLDCLLVNGPSPNGLVLTHDESALFVAMTGDNALRLAGWANRWRASRRAGGAPPPTLHSRQTGSRSSSPYPPRAPYYAPAGPRRTAIDRTRELLPQLMLSYSCPTKRVAVQSSKFPHFFALQTVMQHFLLLRTKRSGAPFLSSPGNPVAQPAFVFFK
jgi:hypothetical protein